ncbi:uncharacterized protein [Lepeophtheirus salmonis]|uniref:uncharacterized protein n=1 Tax=Lepeophtheirus salmonis TaxID=72036 RepID=UPI001AE39F51|nr:uncharacterized protein LOC121116741 [Lepeophtheirus salmonis]
MSSKAEPRLNIHEVPKKISRIFFGDQGYQSDYPSPSYGAPSQSHHHHRQLDHSQVATLYSAGLAALILFIIFLIVMIFLTIGWTCYLCCCTRRSSKREEKSKEPPILSNSTENRKYPSHSSQPVRQNPGQDQPLPAPPRPASSELSNPRSFPYYEVPSNQVLPPRVPADITQFEDSEPMGPTAMGKLV